MYFLFFLLHLPHVYQSYDHLTYIVLIFWYIYIYVDVCYSPIFLCVVSFLSLCTWFLLFICNLLFLFYSEMLWWVLFKVFQKYRLSKSFLQWTLLLQSFSRVILLYSTSEYELSDLWFLSYVHLFVVVFSQIAKGGDC